MAKEKIVKQCEGCNRIDGNFCKAYENPSVKWKSGNCPLCSTIRKMEGNQQEKLRIGQKKTKRNKERKA